ncbi:ankyrin repeat-containing domain protein [Aspergillus recurvatus]
MPQPGRALLPDSPHAHSCDMEGDDFVVVDRVNIPCSPDERWLEPTAYLGESSEFQQHLNWLVPGTGEWIEQTAEFEQWQRSPSHGALWVKAIAGAGKSVLIARLVSLLRQQKDVPVLFFFFRQIVVANHGPHALVRDWLSQLYSYSPALQKTLEQLRKRNSRVQDVSFSELWQVLLDTLTPLAKVYCVVDALDELDIAHTAEFLPCLVALGQLAPDRIKLIMSSRPLPNIQKVLGSPSVLEARLENAQVNRDIALFVDYRLRNTQLSCLGEPALTEIKNAIENRAHPSFLYARLLLNELLEKHATQSWSRGSVHESLLSIPDSLEGLYSQMLMDHSRKASVPQDRQLLILQLVTHATRPLRLLEIATVLDFVSPGASPEGDYPDTKAMTRMSCGPLLEILEDETVSIIHHSFTEFLTDSRRRERAVDAFPVIDPQETHHLIATICLRYISAGAMSSENRHTRSDCDSDSRSMFRRNSTSSLQLRRAQMDHPFIDYAARNWFDHARRLPELSEELTHYLDNFMRPGNEAFLAWVVALMKPGKDPIASTISPLHAAAWAGLANYVERLLSTGHDPNVLTKLEEAPLAMAARNGHAEVVEILLRYGAAPDEPDYFGMKPLHHAARANNHTVVKALVEKGVSPSTAKTRDPAPRYCGNAPTSVGETPLQYACKAGAIETIHAMLPFFTLANAQSAIECSIAKSKNNLVHLLVTFPGLDFDSDFGGDCLLRAAEKANFEILQLLLKLGCKPRYRPKGPRYTIRMVGANEWEPAKSALLSLCRYRTRYSSPPLDGQAAAIEKCLDLLLESGCDVDCRDPYNDNRTALHEFVAKGFPGIEKLLRKGADVHATDRQGNTPLHLYRPLKGSESTLDALMRYGARWDATRASDGKTPLHTCFKFVREEDPELLKPYISDWNITDRDGNTVLHGTEWGRNAFLRKLVELGADPNRRNHTGQVPLHTARYADEIDALLSAGADLEARDNHGLTLFLHRVGKDQPRELQQLLDRGANLHAVDFEGNGALALAHGNHNVTEVYSFLLKAGADPHHLNHKGDTLLHRWVKAAVESSSSTHSNRQILELLLGNSEINPTAQNNEGRTILHCMCSVVPGYRNSPWRPDENVMEWFPSSTVKALIEIEDYHGQRPIHVAAAISEQLVAWLMQKGAALTALTYKQQNLLHIAAISKQSNTLGLLLESLPDSQRQLSINQRDEEGRTPLFHACRLGHLQSVSILLQAGADVHIADRNGETPLHACAVFRAQCKYPDLRRCQVHDGNWRKVQDEDEALGVDGIVRALRAHGADILARDQHKRTPLDVAVQYANEEMVAALLGDTEEALQSLPEGSKVPSLNGAGHLLLAARHGRTASIVDGIMRNNGLDLDPVDTYRWLLKLRAYDAIQALARLGMAMVVGRGSPHTSKDFLQDLIGLGLSEQLETLGKMRQGTQWINGTAPDLRNGQTEFAPFLILAARRETPSVDLLKVIVETFHADLNIQTYEYDYGSGERKLIPQHSPLSILAKGEHWWQPEGLLYLLQRGADPDLCNGKGQSPLHIAAGGGYRRKSIVRTLLENGANPNQVDSDGNTPLSLAAGDVELVQLLLQHGADIHLGSNPILFTAITKQDVNTVRIILETGIDCNKPFSERRSSPEPEPNPEDDSVQDLVYGDADFGFGRNKREKEKDHQRMLLCRPLHYACHARFNKVSDREKAVEVVELLLAHGADPFLSVDLSGSKDAVIHDAIYQWGILEPFLAEQNLDLERRDGQGRTMLLVACSPVKKDGHTWDWTMNAGPPKAALPNVSIRRSDAIRRLCHMGADVAATDANGNTALHLLLTAIPQDGSSRGDKFPYWDELIAFLLAQWPEMTRQCNKQGYTPFHVAAEQGQVELLTFLAERGSNPLEPDPNGNTVLHNLAVMLAKDRGKDTLSVFDAFAARGLDINARNSNGETPLFRCISSFSCELGVYHAQSVIEGFCERGADITAVSNSGENMLHLVARMPCTHWIHCRHRLFNANETGAFEFLMGLGLDPLQEDGKQRTAVDVAAAYGKEHILELFKKG